MTSKELTSTVKTGQQTGHGKNDQYLSTLHELSETGHENAAGDTEAETPAQAFLSTMKQQVSTQGFGTLQKLFRRFMLWCDHEGLDPYALTVQDAVRYQGYWSTFVTKAGTVLERGSVINHLKVARKFYTYLINAEVVASNPFACLRYPRSSGHLSRNVLTEAQMGCLLRELAAFHTLANPRSRLRRYRVHVIAEFLYASGLRIAEASALTENQLDLERKLVYVAHGKGGKARTAFLTTHAADILKEYLAHGRTLVMGNYERTATSTLFGVVKDRLQTLVNTELSLVCKSLGLPVITTHGFRYSLGTHLLRAGCDMRHIQVILGHEALQTTQLYTRVDKDDLRRVIDTHHPRQWRQQLEHE